MGVIRHYLTIDGRSTEDFNTWISGGGTFDSPERDVELVSVPGRNGDLAIDNGRFNNIEVEYECFISKDLEYNIHALRSYLGSLTGYKVLEDTYHPEVYRLALFTSGVKVKPTTRNLAGEFTLTFNCKPQRCFKSGKDPIEYTQDGTIVNFTNFDARPLIRVYGTGTFGVGEDTITITQANEYTDIDCDLMDAYKGSVNCNSNIVLNSGKFPTLPSGESGISLDGVDKVIVYPRWFTL